MFETIATIALIVIYFWALLRSSNGPDKERDWIIYATFIAVCIGLFYHAIQT